MRESRWERQTLETSVSGVLCLDGQGLAAIDTGIGFLDHMLAAWCRFSLFDLQLTARGDLHVDAHHTIEDCGIVLGLLLKEALGDKSSLERTGSALFPMDEALAQIAVDFSGRGFLRWNVRDLPMMLGAFPGEMGEEFFRAVAVNAGATLHIHLLAGSNSHHILESIFKGVGKAMGQAASFNRRIEGVLSTKGAL